MNAIPAPSTPILGKARSLMLLGLLSVPLMCPIATPPDLPEVAIRRRDHAASSSAAMVSLAFWVCLLSATALYGLVVLAPKVVRWSHRADDFAANQQRLLNLREEIDYAERLSQEWERHSELVATPGSPSPRGGGERSILVEDALRYQGPATEVDPAQSAESSSIGMRVFQVVAGSQFLQAAGLVGSAALLIVAFTLLMESNERVIWNARRFPGPTRSRRLSDRYRLTASGDRSSP